MGFEEYLKKDQQIQREAAKPLIDFEKAPKELTEFKLGDALTRENFTSFLILTFGVSRGDVGIQKLFIEWLTQKYGFDYTKVMDTFVAKGFTFLDSREIAEITENIARVPEHRKHGVTRPITGTAFKHYK